MAQIGNKIIVTGLSGFLIIRWKKASSPLAEVGRNDNPSTLTFPYDDTYVIADIAPVVYIVELWRSDDGISLDQLITSWSQDASETDGSGAFSYFQYKVGRGWNNTTPVNTGSEVWADPENEDTVLTDERLDGFTKDQLIVHEAGYGNLLDAEYDLVPGGGIELLGGKTFDEGVSWTITASLVNEISTPPAITNEQFAGVQEIIADIDFFTDSSNNLYNKLCPINGAGSTIQVTFPDLALIPGGTHVTFNTHKGSQNYLILQFDAGDTVRFLNQDVNVIYIAKCQIVSLYFSGGVCYVTTEPSNALRRGMVAPDYDANRDTDTGALIYADESTGVLDKSDYPGLYEFAAQLSGSAVCVLGSAINQWSYDSGGGVYPNKRKWGIDTGAETFRVPHLSGMVAKYSSTPGVYETDQVGAHSLTYDYKQGKSDDNESGVSGEYLRKSGASGGTNYGNTSITYNIQVGLENLIKSYSQKPFIYL